MLKLLKFFSFLFAIIMDILFLVFYLKNASREKPLVIIATTHITELRSFEENEDGFLVGAMTSMTLLENKLMSLIDKLSGRFNMTFVPEHFSFIVVF